MEKDYDLEGVLADIRENFESSDAPTGCFFTSHGALEAWPVPYIYDISDLDPWADRYDNPKD